MIVSGGFPNGPDGPAVTVSGGGGNSPGWLEDVREPLLDGIACFDVSVELGCPGGLAVTVSTGGSVRLGGKTVTVPGSDPGRLDGLAVTVTGGCGGGTDPLL